MSLFLAVYCVSGMAAHKTELVSIYWPDISAKGWLQMHEMWTQAGLHQVSRAQRIEEASLIISNKNLISSPEGIPTLLLSRQDLRDSVKPAPLQSHIATCTPPEELTVFLRNMLPSYKSPGLLLGPDVAEDFERWDKSFSKNGLLGKTRFFRFHEKPSTIIQQLLPLVDVLILPKQDFLDNSDIVVILQLANAAGIPVVTDTETWLAYGASLALVPDKQKLREQIVNASIDLLRHKKTSRQEAPKVPRFNHQMIRSLSLPIANGESIPSNESITP